MKAPKVSVIILNYNGKKHLQTCLESLEKSTYKNLRVTLVDNASTDGSVEFVQERFPHVKIMQHQTNLGFAEGNNMCIRKTKKAFDYIFLLNNDTEVQRKCLEELIQVSQSDPQIGICTGKLLMFDDREIINAAGGECDVFGFAHDRGVFERDKGQYDHTEEVFDACGAAMLIKHKVIEEVGLFDSKFWTYSEDTDLSWRARLCGYKIVYVPSAIVYHKFGGTGGTAHYRRRYFSSRNLLRSMLKNCGQTLLIKMVSRFFVVKFGQILLFLFTGRVRVSVGLARAILWNLKCFPDTYFERKKIQQSRRVPDNEVEKFLVRRSLEIQLFKQGYLSRFKKDFQLH